MTEDRQKELEIVAYTCPRVEAKAYSFFALRKNCGFCGIRFHEKMGSWKVLHLRERERATNTSHTQPILQPFAKCVMANASQIQLLNYSNYAECSGA